MLHALSRTLVLWSLLAAATASTAIASPQAAGVEQRRSIARLHAPPGELVDLVKVIDGDTIHVRRRGELVKLRLECVDTEERIGTSTASATKPGTVFGEQCALWARRFFDERARPGEPPRIGLYFPSGAETTDDFGRLLCHVVLEDGVDFNVLLVELGKSPYFNKYGNSLAFHEAFTSAQAKAQEEQLGIWDPATNLAREPGAPSARRPYDRLLPWWRARADAVDEFRRSKAIDPEVISTDDLAALAGAAKRPADAELVRVFGAVDRVFEERNGDQTLLIGTPDRDRALRVRIPRERRAAFAKLELATRSREFVQNYLWIRGRVTDDARGFQIRCDERASIELPEAVRVEAR